MAKKKTTAAKTGKKKTTTRRKTTSSRKASTARKAPAKKASRARPQRAVRVQAELTPFEREKMVAEAAYYISERQGFQPGHETENWLAAEQEIDSQLSR